MRSFINRLIIGATLTTIASSAPRKIFEITYNDFPGGTPVCLVSFFGEPPPPATVDKILRAALESAVLVYSSRDILAGACVGDDDMGESQYSGDLYYKAASKRIMTKNEFFGIKTSIQDTGAYLVEIEERKTYDGTKRLLAISLVFPKAPSIQQAYNAAVAEAEKAASRGLDAVVCVRVGDKATRTSWRPLPDPSGLTVFVEYEASTKTIKRKTKVLKKLL